MTVTVSRLLCHYDSLTPRSGQRLRSRFRNLTRVGDLDAASDLGVKYP